MINREKSNADKKLKSVLSERYSGVVSVIRRGATECLVVRTESGRRPYVDIRIYFYSDNGNWLPTRKGVRISEAQFGRFEKAMDIAMGRFD